MNMDGAKPELNEYKGIPSAFLLPAGNQVQLERNFLLVMSQSLLYGECDMDLAAILKELRNELALVEQTITRLERRTARQGKRTVLFSTSDELTADSNNVLNGSSEVSEKAQSFPGSLDQMADNIQVVAAAMEQSTTKLNVNLLALKATIDLPRCSARGSARHPFRH
jgi:hypothetical protein